VTRLIVYDRTATRKALLGQAVISDRKGRGVQERECLIGLFRVTGSIVHTHSVCQGTWKNNRISI